MCLPIFSSPTSTDSVQEGAKLARGPLSSAWPRSRRTHPPPRPGRRSGRALHLVAVAPASGGVPRSLVSCPRRWGRAPFAHLLSSRCAGRVQLPRRLEPFRCAHSSLAVGRAHLPPSPHADARLSGVQRSSVAGVSPCCLVVRACCTFAPLMRVVLIGVSTHIAIIQELRLVEPLRVPSLLLKMYLRGRSHLEGAVCGTWLRDAHIISQNAGQRLLDLVQREQRWR
jgi:hypothetical protein